MNKKCVAKFKSAPCDILFSIDLLEQYSYKPSPD